MDPQASNIPTITPEAASTEVPDSSLPTPRDTHWITILAMGLFVIASLAVVAFLYYQNQQLKGIVASYQIQASTEPSPTVYPTTTPEASSSASATASASPKACTQEAKLCPDGSYVGRTGPNCEFTPCP